MNQPADLPCFHDQIPKELMKIYCDSIPKKMARLSELVDALRQATQEIDLKALRLEVHRLAGNSGIYGFMKVSKICIEFEKDLIYKINNFSQLKPTDEWILLFENYIKKINDEFIKELKNY